MDINNLTGVYNQNPTLQSQYTLQQYLDMFGGSSTGTTGTTAQTQTTTPTSNASQGIIGSNINTYQGGGGGGIPMVGSDGRIADFNEAITARQGRLNNPGDIQSFVNNFTGGGQSPAFGSKEAGTLNTSMLSRGMLGQKDTRATSGIPFGIAGMIAKILPDNYYDKMTLGDQILTQSYMGYTDPTTGMGNKDPFGINVRSGFGNYSEYATKTVDKLNEALAKSAAKFAKENEGVTVDPITGELIGKQSLINEWNRLTKGMQTRRGYYTNVTNKKKDIVADLGLIQKAKDEAAKKNKIRQVKMEEARQRGDNPSAASFSSHSPGGISQATSRAARTDQHGNQMSGWGLKKGGRVRSYFDGGLVSLRRR